MRVTGAVINGFRALGLDHPEQTVWRKDATTLAFRTDTNGDTDSSEIDLSQLAGATLQIRSRIDNYIKVGDPSEPQPNAGQARSPQGAGSAQALRPGFGHLCILARLDPGHTDGADYLAVDDDRHTAFEGGQQGR